MRRQAALQAHTDATNAVPAGNSTRLRGRWLLAARIAWILLFAVALASFLVSLRNTRGGIEHPTSDNAVLQPSAVDALSHAGIALDTYLWVSIGVACVVLVVSVALALILVLRRGDDWMVLLVSVFLVVYTASNVGLPSNGSSANSNFFPDVAFAILVGQQNVPALVIPFAVFLLFPSGRFVPRWSRPLFAAAIIWAIGIAVAPTLFDGLLFLGYPLFIGAIIVCIVYRYRRTSTPVERQQTKWVIVGLVVSLLANQAFWISTQFTPLGQTLYPPLSFLAYQLVLLLVPVTFFVAIQRHRLYDIDTIINRALIYGSLTAILAGVYIAGVIGVQSIVNAIARTPGGKTSPVLIVVTTLLIAALFQPLRRFIQRFIDRRFYRSKYDTHETLETFSTTLRQEVDLSALTGQLVTVVNETMQPEHISLWLRENERRRQ
jgi:hypothetical protein